MRCEFEYLGKSGKREGYHAFRCTRFWCGIIGHSPHKSVTIDGIERVVGPSCKGLPRWHELGHWAELLLSAFFLTPRSRLAFWQFYGLQCGKCARRESFLNTWGGKLAATLKRWFEWLSFTISSRKTRLKTSAGGFDAGNGR